MACSTRNNIRDDTVFNFINAKYISLQNEEVNLNNVRLNKVIEVLIDYMKLADPLFETTYRNIIYGGSFYKGTKISRPTEFDLNLIIKLPINYDDIEFEYFPAFVTLQVKSYEPTLQLSRREGNTLRRIICNGYINQVYFRQWVEGIVSKVINELPVYEGTQKHILHLDHGEIYYISSKKSGPAFTIILKNQKNKYEEEISVDLVAALAFEKDLPCLRPNGSRQFRNHIWFAIPKPLLDTNGFSNNNILWRTSFYYQEKEILSQYGQVKPLIRQMKKLRDVQQWKCIASYYIETLFLNELYSWENMNGKSFTYIFYEMLKVLQSACAQHRIQYYWDTRYNLLERISKGQIDNIANRLNKIIKDIDRMIITDQFVIAKYVLTYDELNVLKDDTSERRTEIIEVQEDNRSWCRLM